MYKRYMTLYDSCNDRMTSSAQTDNTKFLKLQRKVETPSNALFLSRRENSDRLRPIAAAIPSWKGEEKHAGCKSCSLPGAGGGDVKEGYCSIDREGGCENKNLAPLLDPRFNLREVCKQLILLSSHFSQEKLRCSNCSSKHLLTIEALLDEAIELDKEVKYIKLIKELQNDFKEISSEYFRKAKLTTTEDDNFYCNLGQKLRILRKKIQFNDDICSFGC